MVKEQSRTRQLGREQGRSHKLGLKLVQPISMDVVKVDLPAGVTIFRVMTVERFAVLVLAVGASVGRLHRAYTAALLVTTVPYNRLAIVGDNFAILFAWVLLPDLCWGDVVASGGWRAWIISG